MKKKTAIVTGGTANDVPAMACLVMNIKDTNPNLADEIVIYHNGISEKDQELINGIFPTRFILYKSPFDEVVDFDDVVTKYFSPMVFCKYECFKLLDDYECVIWTDYDVVIVDDINELKVKVSCNLKMIHAGKLRDNFCGNFENSDIISKYDIDMQGVSTPVFTIFNSLNNYHMIYDWCIDYTKKLSTYLYLPEQAVFNLVLQEFNIQIDNLSHYAYSTHPLECKSFADIKILHAYGRPKFWDGIYNETWEKNYAYWIKIGGSPYEHRTIKGKLKKTILYRGISKIMRFIK